MWTGLHLWRGGHEMPKHLIRLPDENCREWWMEWSTVVDAPTTYGMNREDMEAHIREAYGAEGLRELPARMARAEETGTSAIGVDLDEVLLGNRAGTNETSLTREQIVAMYCHRTGDERGEEPQE